MRIRHPKSYGYHKLETDEEVLHRLGRDGIRIKRGREIDETFDQWLEGNGQTRKLTYVP